MYSGRRTCYVRLIAENMVVGLEKVVGRASFQGRAR